MTVYTLKWKESKNVPKRLTGSRSGPIQAFHWIVIGYESRCLLGMAAVKNTPLCSVTTLSKQCCERALSHKVSESSCQLQLIMWQWTAENNASRASFCHLAGEPHLKSSAVGWNFSVFCWRWGKEYLSKFCPDHTVTDAHWHSVKIVEILWDTTQNLTGNNIFLILSYNTSKLPC